MAFPILFEYDEDFTTNPQMKWDTSGNLVATTNGIGILSDCISCIVEEQRNGIFELDMEYPVKGIHAEDIQKNRWIVCRANPLDQGKQAFRISDIKKTLKGTMEIHATHISYLLTGYWFRYAKDLSAWYEYVAANNQAPSVYPGTEFENLPTGFGAVTAGYDPRQLCSLLGKEIIDNYGGKFSIQTSGFSNTISERISTRPLFNGEAPVVSVRNAMHGKEGSLLDIFGGVWKWNMFSCTLMTRRGSDKDFYIRYGYNLVDAQYEESNANDYPTYVAYVQDEDNMGYYGVELNTSYIRPQPWLKNSYLMDCKALMTEDELNRGDFSKLQTRAEKQAQSLGLGLPATKTMFDYEELSEGSDKIGIDDTIHIICEPFNISYTTKVTGAKYDVLLERYSEIEIGQASTAWNIGDVLDDSSAGLTESGVIAIVSKNFAPIKEFKTNWGTNLSVYVGTEAIHLLLFVNQHAFLVWLAGSPLEVNVTPLDGATPPTVSWSAGNLNISTSADSTISLYRPYR